MHYIVETVDQLAKLPGKSECFLQVIPNNDNQHPALATVSLIYLRPEAESKGYIIVVDHSEGFPITLDLVKEHLRGYTEIYCLNAKAHSYFLDQPLLDINYILAEKGEKPIENKGDAPLINSYYQRLSGQYRDINKIIPISKLYEYWEEVYLKVKPYFRNKITDFYFDYTKVYTEVEKKGIQIDTSCFIDHFTPHNIGDFYQDQKIYTSYNLYNQTMRPTNAFNGINFLALNKENHSRKCFIPQNNFFVEFDFDGYHVRLIADLLNFELPKDSSIHTYFGKQYFQQDTLTEDQYSQAKQITFQNIYGGIQPEYREIPFFKVINSYLQDLWDTYQYNKGIILPTGKHFNIQEGMYPMKLFNYVIQNLETKTNVELLAKILKLLEGKKSFVNLIVYDSFLVDFAVEDGKDILLNISELLRESKYPVKAKYGKDYDSLIKTSYL
jgi:hypothetical protein